MVVRAWVSRVRLVGPALLALAVVGHGGVAEAAAGSELRTTIVSRTEPLPPGFATTLVSVRCPSGYEVTAGGGEAADPAADNLLETYPRTPTSWATRATRGAGASGDSTLTTYAVCAKNVRLRGRGGVGDYAGGQQLGRSGILCPNDFSPLGAGFAFANPGFDSSGTLIAATPRNSRVTKVRFRQGNPDQFRVTAVCAKPRVQLERAEVPLPPTLEPQFVQARCPRGTKMLGGGVAGTDTQDRITGSFPSGRRTWTAIGLRFVGSTTSTLEATAVCRDQ